MDAEESLGVGEPLASSAQAGDEAGNEGGGFLGCDQEVGEVGPNGSNFLGCLKDVDFAGVFSDFFLEKIGVARVCLTKGSCLGFLIGILCYFVVFLLVFCNTAKWVKTWVFFI